MREECLPLDPDEVRAFWVADGLLITVHGSFPESCWEVRIEESRLTVWPPEFILTRCRTGDVCPQVITPFHATEYFRLGTRPDQVFIHDENGRREIPMEDILTQTLREAIDVDDAQYDEAVGLSARFSFDEALRDAIAKLPESSPSHPDELVTITVEDIGVWFGGIAGLHHLYVRVRRLKRKPK